MVSKGKARLDCGKTFLSWVSWEFAVLPAKNVLDRRLPAKQNLTFLNFADIIFTVKAIDDLKRRRENMRVVEKLLARLKPRSIGTNVVLKSVTPSPLHEHKFVEIPWDGHLGPSVTDFDKDDDCPDIYLDGQKPIKFPMCTYKTLVRCSCGEEKVHAVRALI